MMTMLRQLLIAYLLLFSSIIDAKSYNGFDLSNSVIDKKLIVQGGPPRDSIPSINQPKYVSVAEAGFMKRDDIVLGIKIGNKAFAYPRHILNWHEIVNDQFDSTPFVITYCPLCGSGLAFSSKVKDQHLKFGVSGLLYNNDLVFYDQETESLWSQIEKRAISGQFVGVELKQLLLEHTTWEAWEKANPATVVLSDDQGFKRNYRHDPYTGYDTSSQVFFKTLRQAPKDFHSKEKVLGITINGEAKAYPFSELNKFAKASFQDKLAGTAYTVHWNAAAQSATLIAQQGETLTPTVAFWFAWYNFHPEAAIFRAE